MWLFYIKTTETCNLDCFHCFTNGKNGRKIYFNPNKVASWINKLKEIYPERSAHFEFHGGEPFLAPITDLWRFYNETKDIWPNATYGTTTNLVYKLTEERLEFMDKVLEKRVGTSWDPVIRFSNEKQRQLWEDNVKFLVDRGYQIKVFVSLTNDALQIEPKDLQEYFANLGIQEIDLERVTSDGNATKNLDLFPSNINLQKYFLKWDEQIDRDLIYNTFMENVYSKFEENLNNCGTFCRDCEQKLFTINADGSIAGCPNSAPTSAYATLDDEPSKVLKSNGRCSVIAKELNRDPRCFECPVYKYCNGDCHQLEWEGDICAAPRFLMKKLMENK